MKLYAPKYYKKFKCIADKCEHNCCIGWEIDIDNTTLKKYKNLKNGYGALIIDSISMDETPHFELATGDRCPHLDGQGLCKIISNLGKDYLCDICREHPRFYNYTSVAEVGIGMSCREAARIILSFPDYVTMEHIGEVDAQADGELFDARDLRCKIYEILQDASFSYSQRLDKICREYAIDAGDDSMWLEKIDALEYLDVTHKELFMNYSKKRRPDGCDEYLERFLAYMIYRHCTEALDTEDFCSRLAFCLFCERLLASLICTKPAKTAEDVAILASIISEEIEYCDDNTLSLIY